MKRLMIVMLSLVFVVSAIALAGGDKNRKGQDGPPQTQKRDRLCPNCEAPVGDCPECPECGCPQDSPGGEGYGPGNGPQDGSGEGPQDGSGPGPGDGTGDGPCRG